MKHTIINQQALVIVLIAVLFFFITSCSNISYTYRPTSKQITTHNDIRVGVLRLNNSSNRNYGVDSLEPPSSTLQKAIKQGLEESKSFSKVILCDEESTDYFSKLDFIKEKYNVDAVLVGDVSNVSIGHGPNPLSIIVFPLGIGFIAGLPTGIGYTNIEISFTLKLIDVNSKQIIWSHHHSGRKKSTTIGSVYQISKMVSDKYSDYVNDAVSNFIDKMNNATPVLSYFKTKDIVPLAIKPEFHNQQATSPLIVNNRSKWAIIVGISQYQYSRKNGLTNLIFADDDAKAFALSLRNLGWNESHIKFLTNEEATQRNIMIALESWLTKAGPNDQIVLFWAGHGYPDPEDPEKVYFACYDTDITIPATGYRMDKVRTALEERKAKNVILLADTCHAGKLITRGKRGISIVPQIDKMQKEQRVPKGWVFMVGADTDRQSIEHSSWTNGAFTHSLIKGLNGEADGFQSAGTKDGIVTMGELKDYMNIFMPNETQKVLGVAKRPVITTSTGDPDIWNLTLQVKK